MNFPFFIALRYLKARRSRHIINWISRISIAGITIGTMALVIVLSVFNGLDNLIRSLFGTFDPDIKITAAEGKSFLLDETIQEQFSRLPGIVSFCDVVEENALLKYRDRQTIATVKGVCSGFQGVSGIDSMIVDGTFQLFDKEMPMGVIGHELAGQLGVGLNFINPVNIWVPRRSERLILDPSRAFNQRHIFPSGVFSVQQEYDSKYFIVPVEFARDLFGYEDFEVTAVEIKTDAQSDPDGIKASLQKILGEGFNIQDRMEQHAYFYRVMASEKWAIFLILGFILFIASFNTISSLSLLLLEKKTDMNTLQSMGAKAATIRKIFIWEGILVTGIGLTLGVLFGAGICFIQQQFGIIRFPSSGSFVVDIYPVKMVFADFLMVILMVGIIGLLAAWIPIRIMRKRYFLPGTQEDQAG